MKRYAKIDHGSRHIPTSHPDLRKPVIGERDLPVHVFPRKDPFDDDARPVGSPVKPAIQSRNGNRLFDIPPVRADNRLKTILLDLIFDRRGIKARVKRNPRPVQINPQLLDRINEAGESFRTQFGIVDIDGTDGGKPEHESLVFRYRQLFFAFLMLVP